MKEAAMPELIPVDIVNDKFEWLEVVAAPAGWSSRFTRSQR